ncbi:MAG TPA: GTPase, partial [Chitinophagales bacterium]|nr:GTPase [Chitinophagales bacterium]
PEAADYPFTTLVPNLGMVNYKGGRSFVMADIPGIIEGAAEGKGLGLRFLRHIERNSVLLFMVPIDSNDVWRDYNILLSELGKYSPELLGKDKILAISKCDLADEELIKMTEKELKKKLKKEAAVPLIFISAATGYGIDKLKDQVMKVLDKKEEK